MNKQVLISIRPEHTVNVLNGSKTIEFRKVVLKWVLEELAKENTVKFLMYVTKGNELLLKLKQVDFKTWEETGDIFYDVIKHKYLSSGVYQYNPYEILNGKVVASFDVSKIEVGYGLYALHISNINIFDKPKELSDYYYFKNKWVYSGMDCPPYVDEVKVNVTKGLRNMMTVWVEE